MSRRVGCAVVALVGLFAFGLLIVWVMRGRVERDRLACMNNLRELGQFAEEHARLERTADPATRRDLGLLPSIPPGTVVNPALPSNQRLSWVVHLLPTFNQQRQPSGELLGQIDRSLPWDAEPHKAVARTRLVSLLCPGDPALTPTDPARTQYVGNGGVGANAASLPLTPFPFFAHAPIVAPPTAGCFRYNAPTPFTAVADGLAQSILFAEVAAGDAGPWLRGGPSTVRTLLTGPTERPAIGVGGQFGGTHPGGANFAFADGHVRFLTGRTTPAVLEGMFTISGSGVDPLPGE